MKKWYDVELFDEMEINSLRLFLFSIGVKFETSGCGKGVHFEIYCNEFTAKMIDDYIKAIFVIRFLRRLIFPKV